MHISSPPVTAPEIMPSKTLFKVARSMNIYISKIENLPPNFTVISNHKEGRVNL